MDILDLNILPIIDHTEKFIGVVTQEEIVRKILIKTFQEA